jgi:glycosyltransferase involved in cell wall biosynthesis
MQRLFGVGRPYAVYAGQLRTAHKNLGGLLRAFALCRDALPPRSIQLVLVGKRSWTTTGLDDLISSLGLAGDVVLTGHISSGDLPIALSGARMLAFPSLSEGFGFAVTEAMACGAPVVAARATSLPEVVGDAGLLVDPDSPEELSRAMLRLFSDDALAAELRERGLARAAQFSWSACAGKTLAEYERARST